MYIYYICLAIIVFGFSLRHLVKNTREMHQPITPQSLIACSLTKYDWWSMSGFLVSVEIALISVISYQLPNGVLQSPLIYIPLVLLSLSMIIFIHRLYQKENLDRFKYNRVKRRSVTDSDNAAIFSSTMLFCGSIAALIVFALPVYNDTEANITHADFVSSIGTFHSSPAIETKYATGNGGNHSDTPATLHISRHYIKGYTKGKLVFDYQITKHRYAQRRDGLVLDGKFLKKGAWLKSNDIANVGLYRGNNTIFMSPSNGSKMVRINLCGSNKDNMAPYSSDVENMLDDNEAFVRE